MSILALCLFRYLSHGPYYLFISFFPSAPTFRSLPPSPCSKPFSDWIAFLLANSIRESRTVLTNRNVEGRGLFEYGCVWEESVAEVIQPQCIMGHRVLKTVYGTLLSGTVLKSMEPCSCFFSSAYQTVLNYDRDLSKMYPFLCAGDAVMVAFLWREAGGGAFMFEPNARCGRFCFPLKQNRNMTNKFE